MCCVRMGSGRVLKVENKFDFIYPAPKQFENDPRWRFFFEKSAAKSEPEPSGGIVVDGVIQDSWEIIIASTQNGKYRDWYQIGDMKPLDLGTEGTVNMQIVAFDADELADDTGYAPITWISKELLATSHRMNPKRSGSSRNYTEGTGTIGGWDKSEMKQYVLDTVVPNLPSEIRNAVKTVKKYTRIYNTSGSAQNDVMTEETFWLPSRHEMFDGTASSYETKGPRYSEAFPDNASRMKYKVGASSASWWWLRSAMYDYGFNTVNSGGSDGNFSANISGTVVLGFCI